MSTHDHSHLESLMTSSLHELLAGRMPDPEHLKQLSGDALACLMAMIEALQEEGVQSARKVFLALMRDNRPG